MGAEVVRDNNHASRARSSNEISQDSDYSAGSMPYLTQQYALPIHHASLRSGSSDGTESGEQTPRPENTLRRKTPNGTLNAGYDGSSHDSNPQKHQLLPMSEANAQQYQQFPAPQTKRTFLQHQQRHSNSNNGLASGWSTPTGPQWQGSQYPAPQYGFPVMDSMLNQIPVHGYNAQQYYGQSIPSVIQPSFQYVGPTASGLQGSGPYGPYWHDGTFVPYRPAAIRDPRFYNHPSSNWPESLLTAPYTFQSAPWQPSPYPSPSGQWPQVPNNFPMMGQATGYNVGLDSAYTPAAGQYVDPTTTPGGQFYGQNTYTPHFGQENGVGTYGSQPSLTPAPGTSVEGEFGASSPNGTQRDKAFAWALQQYRELLCYIQHTKRQQHHGRHVHGQQQTHKPSFYPKPPKPSRSGSSVQVNKRRKESDSASTDGLHRSDSAPNREAKNSVDTEAEMDTSNRAASLWSPNGLQFHDDEYSRRASYDQYSRPDQQWTNVPQQQADRFRTLRRSSGSTTATNISSMPNDDSPISRAQSALSMLVRLCQETEWQWTDGMHLGGCLAYGLGNYQKALRWYTKVLDMDPKHLEATSNLAATLLALGQRQEAEQHWMKVVKAAPNHFEAVEHLIGMLCNEQRSRDAVRIIEYVERSLRQRRPSELLKATDRQSECSSSTASRSPCVSEMSDKMVYDFDAEGDGLSPDWREPGSNEPGFGSSGFAIPGSDNGRILALIHAKGNMLYSLGDNAGAARAFEDAVLIAAGRRFNGIQALVRHILSVVSTSMQQRLPHQALQPALSSEPILLTPEYALAVAKLCFPTCGELPGLQYLPGGPQNIARRAVVSTTSNSLLSLAKIFQDGMSHTHRAAGVTPLASGVRDILALYYLSLSLQPSPSTANNVGILLASVQQTVAPMASHQKQEIPGVVPGSGIALALQYYNYGLQLDQSHAHLYTNLGSLLKDIGQLDAAIKMYERAVMCDGKFDIALANLANAVKDKGRINDAIVYYKRAVEVSPEFAEAVCGLANALNSVCAWNARGGIAEDNGKRDRWHVNPNGMLLDARQPGAASSGWLKRVLDIVGKQLAEGEAWGKGTLTPTILELLVQQLTILEGSLEDLQDREASMRKTLTAWAGHRWEGARITRLIERATRRIGWHWYQDTHVKKRRRTSGSYDRPQLPASLTVPTAPTVLPFHTFTCPMSAKQVRLISQRNGLRISVSTLRSPWLSKQVSPPPKPPAPSLRVGYLSSDFNNHPLAHLMQSVFGMHNQKRVEAYCYATTASDSSVHRQQIENEAPHFRDVSSWTTEKLVNQIVKDGVHVLVNLNGYTRGARNEVFAARPAPIQMSFMGFAGTLGAEWCDYLLADETAIPPSTLRPWRRNVDLEDQFVDENTGGRSDDWIYGENIIYCRDTFFCCDHKQSAPDAQEKRLSWEDEQKRRWKMRKELFPAITDKTIIFGNFNQLYKIEPTTFRTWLRILAKVPDSILWLLRFPDLGEQHLLETARKWAGDDVANRVVFTDVAPKALHISRARVCDLVLDTAECNGHTTAADVLWSGTPLLTLPRYSYKMCSRMAASILKGALPKTEEGRQAAEELVATDEDDYEEKAIALGKSFAFNPTSDTMTEGRIIDLRKILYTARWSSALFDTKRWVRDLEDAYEEAWRRWVAGEGGDIWLDRLPRREDVA